MIIITIGDLFGSYLRSSPSAIWLVLPWTVTFILIDTSDSDYDESSEYDSDEEHAAVTDNVVPALQPADTITRSLVRWFVIFICIWQTFSLSDRAIEICLRFFGTFLSVLGSSSSSALVISVASALPVTLFLLRKFLKSERSDFISYVVCPSRFLLYKLSDCFQVRSAGDKSQYAALLSIFLTILTTTDVYHAMRTY